MGLTQRSELCSKVFKIGRLRAGETEELVKSIERVTPVEFEVISGFDDFIENELIKVMVI